METTEKILREFDTLTIVGVSRDPTKTAHSVPRALQAAGFHVVPVNPTASGELLGETVYARLADVPRPVDVVVVFRPSNEAAEIARQAVAVGARALWLQLGIVSDEARQIAESNGLLYVEDHCTAVERALHQIVKNQP